MHFILYGLTDLPPAGLLAPTKRPIWADCQQLKESEDAVNGRVAAAIFRQSPNGIVWILLPAKALHGTAIHGGKVVQAILHGGGVISICLYGEGPNGISKEEWVDGKGIR